VHDRDREELSESQVEADRSRARLPNPGGCFCAMGERTSDSRMRVRASVRSRSESWRLQEKGESGNSSWMGSSIGLPGVMAWAIVLTGEPTLVNLGEVAPH
jgi:hypothetical protein